VRKVGYLQRIYIYIVLNSVCSMPHTKNRNIGLYYVEFSN